MADISKVAEQDEMSRVMGKRELFFLLHMLESGGIAGFEDPYRGYLMDELEEAWDEQRQKLLDQGLLIQQGEKLEMELVTEALLAVLESPYAIRLEIRRSGKLVYDGFVHILPQLIVERIQDEQDPEMIRISAIANLELSLPILERVFPADLAVNGVLQPILMPADIFDAVMTAEDEEEQEILEAAGPEAHQLWKLAKQAEDQGRLTFMHRKGPLWKQHIVTYGLGPAGGWVATLDEDRNVKVENYRRGKLGQAVKAHVKDILTQENSSKHGGVDHDQNQD